MFAKWKKSRNLLVALGIAVIGWATFQTDVAASGEFVLTDRIGEGSILRVSQAIRPEYDAQIVYFQDGRPVHLTQLQSDQPYCKFLSMDRKLGEHLTHAQKLVVQFKNVARARWFFDHGVELECAGAGDHEAVTETDFHRALGHYFQLEKHTSSAPDQTRWL